MAGSSRWRHVGLLLAAALLVDGAAAASSVALADDGWRPSGSLRTTLGFELARDGEDLGLSGGVAVDLLEPLRAGALGFGGTLGLNFLTTDQGEDTASRLVLPGGLAFVARFGFTRTGPGQSAWGRMGAELAARGGGWIGTTNEGFRAGGWVGGAATLLIAIGPLADAGPPPLHFAFGVDLQALLSRDGTRLFVGPTMGLAWSPPSRLPREWMGDEALLGLEPPHGVSVEDPPRRASPARRGTGDLAP